MSSESRATARGYAFLRAGPDRPCGPVRARRARAPLRDVSPDRPAPRLLRLVRAGRRGRADRGRAPRASGLAANDGTRGGNVATARDDGAVRPARAGVARAFARGGSSGVRGAD